MRLLKLMPGCFSSLTVRWGPVQWGPFVLSLWSLLPPCSLGVSPQATGAQEPHPTWQGFERTNFRIEGRSAYLVRPSEPASGKPWVWRARFPNYHPEIDIELLKRGFHVGYVDVAGLYGSPQAIKLGEAFYEHVVHELGLSRRPALEGVSRGGLFIYHWAAKHPDKVACLYADTPVCDFKSWPLGQGTGIGSEASWRECLKAYGLTEEQALAYRENPVDQGERLAAARIPMLHIVSENDQVVPPRENTYRLQSAVEANGHELSVISVPEGTQPSNGHHFEHPAVDQVVRFIVRHSAINETAPSQQLDQAQRILFLGDSITYAGDYLVDFEAWLNRSVASPDTPQPDTPRPETKQNTRRSPPLLINMGLPSETVSGLSEPNHAGGRFPRPVLSERLERVLAVAKPDLVIACYGINCGIYQPFSTERLAAYQHGLSQLKTQAEASGASCIFVTPPFYDDQRARKEFSYNEVLDQYADWLLGQRLRGWTVIDLHFPMHREVRLRRRTDPTFTFQPDAVHPNRAGHTWMATELIRGFGGTARWTNTTELASELRLRTETLAKLQQAMRLRRNAYLSTAGHKRPGIPTGLAIEEAEARIRQLRK